jgi:hypothetical protein
MNVRKFGLLAAAIAALSPAVSSASDETGALNACARAFASSLASPGAAAPAFKVVYGGSRYAGSVTDYFSHAYTFDLYANNQRTGLPVARASCSTNSHGVVIALSPVPMETAGPALAAR